MFRGLGKLVDNLEKVVEKIDPSQVEKVPYKLTQALGKVIGGNETTTGRKPTGSMSTHTGGNGKRRALLIGINYVGTQAQLSGCVNDVNNVHNFIKDQFNDIRILTDDQQGQSNPTKANIIESFKWLVSGAQPGDSFFLHYSGHGSTQKDEDGDEVDGLDNTICPVDYNSAGMIVDDEMNTILVQALPEGSRLVAIFDCCHSGTMLDLPFMYTIDGNLEVTCKSNKQAALEGGIKALKDFQKGDKQAAMKEAFSALSLLTKQEQNTPNSEAEKKTLATKFSKADVLMFSGCRDNQTSADAKINGQGCGAMSWALLAVLSSSNGAKLSLKDLLAQLREKLQGKYEQIPQMSTSHEAITKAFDVQESASVKPTAMMTHEGGYGKRRALLIGINYFGSQNPLSNCISNVRNVNDHLKDLYSDIRVLSDDQSGESLPTRANIIASFKWLVEGAQPGDSFFLHFSGQSAAVKDQDGDEQNGKDDAICPVDHATAGLILDDEMNTLLVQSLPVGSRLAAIFDCAHAGTMLDLPFDYIIDNTGQVVLQDSKRSIVDGGFQTYKDIQSGNAAAAAKGAFGALSTLATMNQKDAAVKKTRELKSSNADVIMFSAHRDAFSNDANYVVSSALLSVLDKVESGSKPTLSDLLVKMKDSLKDKKLEPQMSTSHAVDQTMSWTFRELATYDSRYSPIGKDFSSSAPTKRPFTPSISIKLDDEASFVFESEKESEDEYGEDEYLIPPVSPSMDNEVIPQDKDAPFCFAYIWSIVKLSVYSLPAVCLAVLLTLLDAMSYGIIVFPHSDPHIPATGPQAGISMFLASTIISQIVYTGGGSAFKGAIGSMMIEVMPFLHIMCQIIETQMVGQSDHSILATIMVSYASSTIVTGLVFILLGVFKLGTVIHFFPRHILVGCIGGIGLFLILTGIEVTAHVPPNFVDHPMLVPIFYAVIPFLFYIVVFSIGIPLDELRKLGWLFNFESANDAPFYIFWTFFDFKQVKWSAVMATIPTQLALTFFGILHVPINVPALAVSTRQDVDLSNEIIGHGLSNILSGLAGTTQNYLVYSNSLLYIRSGGNSTTSGVILILMTIFLWVKGSFVIQYVPTIIVGALIFHLGVDLLKESVYDTWSVGMHPSEYFTIIIIVMVMGVVGFTEGIMVGILLACVFFVVMYSRRSIIRETFSGAQLRSNVHRLFRQQQFLDKVGIQIHIIKLQGFMFFGTVSQLDSHIKGIQHCNSKTRFIILDFSLISGVDYSGLETFLRIKRHLETTKTHLIFCGLQSMESELRLSGIFDTDDSIDTTLVHTFETLNNSLEWCENYLLSTYYRKSVQSDPKSVPNSSWNIANLGPDMASTPRGQQVSFAADLIIKAHPHETPLSTTFNKGHEPFRFLMQALSDTVSIKSELLDVFGPMFEHQSYDSGDIIYSYGSHSKALYIVESGELGLQVSDSDKDARIVETLLPGTMVGELEMFSGRPRICSLVALSDATVWCLSKYNFTQLSNTHPHLALKFVTEIAVTFDTVRFYNTVHHLVNQLGIFLTGKSKYNQCFIDPRIDSKIISTKNGLEMAALIEKECALFDSSIRDECVIPNVVHLTIGPKFRFENYLSVKSMHDIIKPDMMFAHSDNFPMDNELFTRAVKEFNLELVVARKGDTVYNITVAKGEHMSDIVRMETLIRYGGMYFDLDVFVLKDMKPFFKKENEFVIGYQNKEADFGLNNGLMLSKRCSRFMIWWYRNYRTMNPKDWDYHSVKLPLKLYDMNPSNVLAVDKELLSDWHHLPMFQKKYDPEFWKDVRAIHSFYRPYRKLMQKNKKVVDFETVKDIDNNFARWARSILYGGPPL
ncbi:hypothetical protein HDV01_003457 [Terramyces sp. JEL0728]|nr:hypothetical protein HDV01_003457 [Terramyces sp. JEL0728]